MEIVKNNSSILITCNTDDFTKVNDIWRADITGINRFIYQYYTCRIKVFNRSSSLDDRVSVTVPNKITKMVNAADNQKWYNLDGFDTNRLSLSEQTIFLDIYFDPNKTYVGSRVQVEFATDNSSIYCYNNNVEDTVVFKPFSNLFHLTGIFRDNIDLINPTFEIEFPEVPTFNYVFINMFGRYYFVDSIECVRNGLYRIYCSIDVLMSYNEQLPDLQVYVTRQENNINNFIIDNKLPVTTKHSSTILKGRESTWDAEYNLPNDLLFHMNGGEVNNNLNQMRMSITIFSFDNNFRIINNKTYLQPNISPHYVTYYFRIKDYLKIVDSLNKTTLSAIIKSLFGNNAQAIYEINMIPFDMESVAKQLYPLPNGETYALLKSTNLLIDNGGGGIEVECYVDLHPYDYPISAGVIEFPILNDWKDLNVSNSCLIYVPFLGFKELDLDFLYSIASSDTVRVSVAYTYRSVGKSAVSLYVVDNNDRYIGRLATYECDMNMRVPFGESNRGDILRNQIFTAISTGINAGFSYALLNTTEAPVPRFTPKTHKPTKKYLRELNAYNTEMTRGQLSISKDITEQTVGSFNMKHTINIEHNVSDVVNNLTFGGRAYAILFKPIYEEPTGYAHIVGKPSSYSGRLGDLTGYTEVGAFHLEGINGITTEEKDLLESLLRSGIIM